jgi:hypothetical protein
MKHLRYGNDSVNSTPSVPFVCAIVNPGRASRYYRNETFLMQRGGGPLATVLQCVNCRKFGGWLSDNEAGAPMRRGSP